MGLPKVVNAFLLLYVLAYTSDCAKINTPRVLLPWFENLQVNFTFEIIDGGCYSWSLSRDDIIDLEQLYDESWGHCSRSARVSVSKACVPPGSAIILIEDTNAGEILRGDVDVDNIKKIEVLSTTWELFLEEAPEAFEVIAYDAQGNKFSTLEGISFTWSVQNLAGNAGEPPLVTFVKWRDTDYEAPRGVAELESKGLRSHSSLLYGHAMGECHVHVCLGDICTSFNLKVVASVLLTPATAIIAPGDVLHYRIVRTRAGRLTIQDITETLYTIKVPDTSVAILYDSQALVKGMELGTTNIHLMSGATKVAQATLTVAQPYGIRVTIRPSNVLIRGEMFVIHCALLDVKGHVFTAGSEVLIRLSVEGEANVDLLRSTENGTLTDAVARNAGPLKITAKLYSVAGKTVSQKVEGNASAMAVEPLEVVPKELYVAWTNTVQELTLQHRGGGDEEVVWSLLDSGHTSKQSPFAVTTLGIATVSGIGDAGIRVHLKKYPYIKATGRIISAPPESVRVTSSGHTRVGKLHWLHVALTAAHMDNQELYNFHTCNCASFAVSLLEGPEPHNVTSATWVQPIEGACCVLECEWSMRGVATLRVSRGRVGDVTRVAVRAAPALVWPQHVAALPRATLPVLADGEALVPQSSEPRIAELVDRDGPPPHRFPDVHLFTFSCLRKGDSRMELVSDLDGEREVVQFQGSCAPHVSRIRLEPSETPGNCTGGPRLWLRPGHDISVKVTLLDAIGRELLDELGPRMSWDIEPHHPGLEFKATDRLFVQTHPDYEPVPVPFKYYQLVTASEQAIGWNGALKTSIPDATASIQARVVAPLTCDPEKANIAWEGEAVSNVATVVGGSGRYAVETPKGVSATVDNGMLSASVPGPGSYEFVVTDLCVQGEKKLVEVNIEEVLSVEVSTSRAVGVDSCVPITALVKGVSHRYLSTGRSPEWRAIGDVVIKSGALCGIKEGSGKVRASFGGVWSPEIEVLVFPPLEIIPSKARVPPGAKIQLRHQGGPPSHLATLQYHATTGLNNVEVSASGAVQGLSMGTARIKLVAVDMSNVEMASAESEVEVIPIAAIRVKAATQTLLVRSPSPIWVEAGGLTAGSLSTLHPPPRVTWTVRDPTVARLYTTHVDDMLERSSADGLSVRLVPLKPGAITIDVRVRNMGQIPDTRSWDSTIEIIGISDIRTSVEGLSKDLYAGDRLALAVGAVVRLKSLPRGTWKAYEDGAFVVDANGEVRALQPGFGIIVVQSKDEKNNIYRESAIHVEVSVPCYCTVEPSGDVADGAVRLVMRSSVGRALLAPAANVSVVAPLAARARRAVESAHGNELLISGLEAGGTFMTFQGSTSGVTLRDEVLVMGIDSRTDRVVVTGGWGVCLDGVGWKAPPAVSVFAGSGVSLALLSKDLSGSHLLRLDRPHSSYTLQQFPLDKMEFLPGEWPPSMVPLSFHASGLNSGPIVCNEEQKIALVGLPIQLPYICRTKTPHTAEPTIDILNDQIGCRIIPAFTITEPIEVDLCAEWDTHRACTKVLLLSLIRVSQSTVSLLNPPATFTVYGHQRALRLVRFSPSPGLKLEINTSDGEISVQINNEASTCGHGWVTVKSSLTAQEIRVEVERECSVACGSLLAALLSMSTPYLSTIVTLGAIFAAYLYIAQKRLQGKQIRMPTSPVQPNQTVLPPSSTPSPNRSRTSWRSPYASGGPVGPVYGDTSVLPDQSFSPNNSRNQPRFL